ncbi:MAG: cytochrome c peroxidase [Bacteroidota bacterium]
MRLQSSKSIFIEWSLRPSSKAPFNLLLIFICFLSFMACESDPPPSPDPSDEVDRTEVVLEVPDHFRQPEIPASNMLTQAKIDLGKALFFDPILSRDQTVSCASCHPPELGFADPNILSIGIDGNRTKRHSMSLVNLFYANSFFWDGRSPSLEAQAVLPIFDPLEMDNTEEEVLNSLNSSEKYLRLFKRAFGDTAKMNYIGQALASFERTLISSESTYDQFLASQDSSVFTAQEWRGYKLFFAERSNARHAECFHCHSGFNLDDRANPAGGFRNNALDEFYEDQGRGAITQRSRDVGKFKVPTLRNIEFTAPYMHDGRFQTLEEVIDHYASGGQPHVNRDPLMLNILVDEEGKKDLLAFLKTLSDPNFLSNPEFRPE